MKAFNTYTYWCLFLHCFSFFHLLEMGNILFCTYSHDFWQAFSKVHNSMSISKYKLRSQSSHISFALTFQQFPPPIGKARPWPLTSLIVWGKKPHCAPLTRLDEWLQKINLRQVEGQVKWNLIDETVQETNLVHTVLRKDSWACCDSISSRISSNTALGTVLSQYAEMKRNTSAASLLFTPKPLFLLSNWLCSLNACLP